MKIYSKPEIEIIKFVAEDVITTSGYIPPNTEVSFNGCNCGCGGNCSCCK